MAAAMTDTTHEVDPLEAATQAATPLITPEPALRSAGESIDLLVERWNRREPPTSTGLTHLDALLNGGLRPGDFMICAGAAKAGKSALIGQCAYELAARGAIVVVASCEMPEEVWLARWMTRLVYLQAREESLPGSAVTFSNVMHGDLWGETPDTRLTLAMRTFESAAKTLYVQRLPFGATTETISELVKKARASWRAKNGDAPEPPTVVVVDPMQRLFADQHGPLKGVLTLDKLNGDEAQRAAAVAAQLYGLAQKEKLAVLATSDTTKAGARGEEDAGTMLRGSYQIAHWATTVLAMRSADNFDALFDELVDLKAIKKDDEARKKAPERYGWTASLKHPHSKNPTTGHALRAVFVQCGGNRAGPDLDGFLTFVGGAMHFEEGKREEKGR